MKETESLGSHSLVNPLRRRFVQGLAAGGMLAGLPAWAGAAATAAALERDQPTLEGTEFDLVIGDTTVNFTGTPRKAITINGGIPGPILRWREGTTVTLRVTNRLQESTSIHWHGILLPFEMDGVPGFSFDGIAPGETFTYQFKVQQTGTYWYHSHTRFQEQLGLYGPIVIDPAGPDRIKSDRDYVLVLSDWTDKDPEWIFKRLKQSSDYFNYQMPTVGDFFKDIGEMGFTRAVDKRKMWNQMRMNPTDLSDVSGSAFTYLANGVPPAGNWTALARAGERVRLRIINSAATTYFDVRIPGLKMTVVSADGQDVEPVPVDEIRVAVAETYDVVVQIPDARAYTIFAQSIDRTGYARGTIAPRLGMTAEVPPLDPKTWLTMADMGMGDMEGHDMSAMGEMSAGAHQKGSMQGMQGQEANSDMKGHDMSSMQGMQNPGGGGMKGHDMSSMQGMQNHGGGDMKGHDMSAMQGMQNHGGGDMKGHDMSAMQGKQGASVPPMTGMPGHDMSAMKGMQNEALGTGPAVDSRSMAPSKSLSDPGPRLRGNGRRVLTYADLRTIGGPIDQRPAMREIVLRLTGNMRRFVWGFDGKKFSEVHPIEFRYGERLRITLINDSMMNHPIHLHGLWSEVESEDGKFQVRKHTVNVQPGKQISYLVTVDARGQWAYHCHLLYHMEAGMMRKIVVA